LALAESRTKQALLAGATGLVGGHLLARLLSHPAYSRVDVLVRRELPIRDPKLIQHVVDFDHLEAGLSIAADDVFCCLGTTIGKAGSREAFRRVDHHYPLALARLGKTAGALQFLMVSSLGANARSRVFYSRVKGETERDIASTGVKKVVFMRPSILRGERQEVRAGERAGIFIGRMIAPLMIGPLRKYRPIDADDVAAAMLYAANHDVPPGAVESDEIERLAHLQNAGNKKAG
jgi:uncharacterized protein YbjT (DUF2867 family)